MPRLKLAGTAAAGYIYIGVLVPPVSYLIKLR